MISAFVKQVLSKMSRPPVMAVRWPTPDGHLVWVDCEMTGLDLERSRLVEIACIITDEKLNAVAELGPLVISQPPEVMEQMSDWCKSTFKGNGLLERIKQSNVTEQEAEKTILDFLRKHTKAGECPIAGNTVHMDRLFLAKYMPKIVEHLHYRIVDVSTVKELVSRWYPPEELANIPKKKRTHLALDDIRESIDELRHYKEHFFRQL